ncbi:DUF2461 family protein [bacterium]|nr:DUF2461 family protein [bacterium]
MTLRKNNGPETAPTPIRFSKKALDFLVKAGKQNKDDWLEKYQAEYEEVLKKPFIALAIKLKVRLRPLAPKYHFPTKGLGRIKRPAFKVARGQPLYKDWLSMIATRPAASRFESNPHLFFGLFPNEDRKIIIACGLWQPTSRQTRRIREAIRSNPQLFKNLFKDKAFKARFPSGFCLDNMATRVPRGFLDSDKNLNWIKLRNFVVMKEISLKAFSSPKFSDELVNDFTQGLRLNRLLDRAIQERE